MLVGSSLLEIISNNESERYDREINTFEYEIRQDTEKSLNDLFHRFNPKLKPLLHGAREAIYSTNPDKERHILVSLREMITHILHGISPDKEVKKWTSAPEHYHNNRPTRKARILYVCRNINFGPFEDFMHYDVESTIKFIELLNNGTHRVEPSLTEEQLESLIVRAESMAEFLLTTWKNTN